MIKINQIKNYLKTLSQRLQFKGSGSYWEQRYSSGGNSGPGSYNALAAYKAEVLNRFVIDNDITSVIEFGCGDGNQLSLATYPEYIGFDVSQTAVAICQKKFALDPTKSFFLIGDYKNHEADLALSLDVIYHLVEDDVYEQHIRSLFTAARKFVIIYSTAYDEPYSSGDHVFHRDFRKTICSKYKEWRLDNEILNMHRASSRGYDPSKFSNANFYIYRRF